MVWKLRNAKTQLRRGRILWNAIKRNIKVSSTDKKKLSLI